MTTQMHPANIGFDDDDVLDRPREECGVFGIWAPGEDVARRAFFALYALQHRGQESCGIATTDGRQAYAQRGMGLVTQAFDEEKLRPLVGHLAIGHTRYSTRGASQLRNAQPYLIETIDGALGVAHNGNLVNAAELRREVLTRGVGLAGSSDTEVIGQMLAAPLADEPPGQADWGGRIARFMRASEGAYSLALLTRDALWGVRDPLGLRPLCIGELDLGGGKKGWALASESCALETIGARMLREVEPGEYVRMDDEGLRTFRAVEDRRRRAFCVFEMVYFARPDSTLSGAVVHGVRQQLGRQLWREAPVEADVVIGVPDSATPAAIGYAEASGIPYNEGLTKNRYIGRTFIQPSEAMRHDRVKLKYNPLRANLEGKRVVVLDDSIVRGTTSGPLVQLLREGGATEVHVRISSPPVRHPCFMGVAMATYDELIAHRMSVEEIGAHIGADSIAYLSVEGMMEAVAHATGDPEGRRGGFCTACFSGDYPLEVVKQEGQTGEERQATESIREGAPT